MRLASLNELPTTTYIFLKFLKFNNDFTALPVIFDDFDPPKLTKADQRE